MKKQLLTGALALSVLMGTSGMALAGDVPALDIETAKASATTIPASSANAEFKITAKGDVSPNLDLGKLTDKKEYTAQTYAAEIEKTKTSLDAAVKNNEMKRADADKILESMEQSLQQIKDGELKLYYADMLDKDGNNLGNIIFSTTTVENDNPNALAETTISIKK